MSSLNIVAPIGYPWDFNGPRSSVNNVKRVYFLPFNRLKQELDGFTLFGPWDAAGADIIHAFNRIPLNGKDFIIGFESHLPRTFGIESSGYRKFLYKKLLSPRCRRIVAISQHAHRTFLDELDVGALTSAERFVLKDKTEVRLPNMKPATAPQLSSPPGNAVQVTFVGNHFARKGGCSTVRMAQISLERKLPFVFNIVSSLQCGGSIWTDPTDASFYQPYLTLLSLPNVRHFTSLPNSGVLELLRGSHFSILTTFADTFGYSAIESMSVGTPVIASRQAALPEFIIDGESGVLLDPARTAGRDDWGPDFHSRADSEFEALFAENVERFAVEAIDRMEALLNDQERYVDMRRAAFETIRDDFSAEAAAQYWDNLYRSCV
ncbi:glycosyltransferase family 4 protein [Mesorhizobium sp. CAU 1741]|uniref:glycosyltransferase family 4 protein n=1 Tax=Mesorhizobium sp. CAU 1741 TaxID=3140366 RepID=UPI00325BC94E